MFANYEDVWIRERAYRLFKISVFMPGRNQNFLGGGHQSLTFLRVNFPAELV